jgi:hypothetical protein
MTDNNVKLTIKCANCKKGISKEGDDALQLMRRLILNDFHSNKDMEGWKIVYVPMVEAGDEVKLYVCSEECYNKVYVSKVLPQCKYYKKDETLCGGEVMLCEDCNEKVCEEHIGGPDDTERILCKECYKTCSTSSHEKIEQDTTLYLEKFHEAMKIISEQDTEDKLSGKVIERLFQENNPVWVNGDTHYILQEEVLEWYDEFCKNAIITPSFKTWLLNSLS